MLFVMKNPSCPDDTTNQTFRNMVTYAKKLEASSLDVVNLYARRTGKSPRELNHVPAAKAIGPENDRHIVEAASEAGRVIAAWGGASGVKGYETRIAAVDRLLRDHELWCVDKPGGTAQPLHPQVWSPAYVFRLWRPAGAALPTASGGRRPLLPPPGEATGRPLPELTAEQQAKIKARRAERRRDRDW